MNIRSGHHIFQIKFPLPLICTHSHAYAPRGSVRHVPNESITLQGMQTAYVCACAREQAQTHIKVAQTNIIISLWVVSHASDLSVTRSQDTDHNKFSVHFTHGAWQCALIFSTCMPRGDNTGTLSVSECGIGMDIKAPAPDTNQQGSA